MKTVEVKLNLPKELVDRARAAGLLTDVRVAAWLSAELERAHRIDQLREDAQKLRAMELAPEDIAAEIDAHREEKRDAATPGSF
jgi:post-segregation antitoxin (ccd killing protein)